MRESQTCTSYDCQKPATHYAHFTFGSNCTAHLYRCDDCMKEFAGRQDEPEWRKINDDGPI